MPIEQQVPVGFAACTLRGSIGGTVEIWNVTFGIDILSPPWTQADTASLYSDFTAELSTEMNVNWNFLGITVRVPLDASNEAVFTHDVTVQGSVVAETIPGNCALLVRKRTGLSGRRNRGRMYWPGLLTDAVVDAAGGITSVRVTALQTKFDTVHANVNAHTNVADLVLLHSWDPADPPSPLPQPTVVTAFQVDNLIATQRRRIAKLRT